MIRRRSKFAVIAAALLALVLSLGVTADAGPGSSGCCCATGAELDDSATCGCCDCGEDADPIGPCDCGDGDAEMPPLLQPPVQESVPAPLPDRCVHTPTLPEGRESLWRAPIARHATGPPIHVRDCIWLI